MALSYLGVLGWAFALALALPLLPTTFAAFLDGQLPLTLVLTTPTDLMTAGTVTVSGTQAITVRAERPPLP